MRFRLTVVLLAVIVFAVVVAPWSRREAPRAQGVDVFLNVTGGGTKKLNIAKYVNTSLLEQARARPLK